MIGREITVPAQDGTEIPLTILSPKGLAAPAPCIYWIHGGGMVMGDRFAQLDIPLEWLDRFGAVVVTVDYRLAPEFTGTTLVDDCYTAMHWTATNAAELGIDPARIVVAGTSAGGGLGAGVTLMSRDRGTPSIAAQVLICPMRAAFTASTLCSPTPRSPPRPAGPAPTGSPASWNRRRRASQPSR